MLLDLINYSFNNNRINVFFVLMMFLEVITYNITAV